eukprot:9490025-Pyramimonas_sp.AAC.1
MERFGDSAEPISVGGRVPGFPIPGPRVFVCWCPADLGGRRGSRVSGFRGSCSILSIDRSPYPPLY